MPWCRYIYPWKILPEDINAQNATRPLHGKLIELDILIVFIKRRMLQKLKSLIFGDRIEESKNNEWHSFFCGNFQFNLAITFEFNMSIFPAEFHIGLK